MTATSVMLCVCQTPETRDLGKSAIKMSVCEKELSKGGGERTGQTENPESGHDNQYCNAVILSNTQITS